VVAPRLEGPTVALWRALMTVEAVRHLYLTHWGEPSRQARFDVGDIGIDIFKWSADASAEGVAVYATIGASVWPLAGCDPKHRIELFMGLLPEEDSVASALAALGLYSFREGVALDHGHTVPTDGPVAPGLATDSFLIMRPREGFLPPLDLSDGLHVDFLQAIPIYKSERAFKAEYGADALMRRWQDAGVAFWNAHRADPLFK
jgi:hypothetical protein